MSRTRVVNVKDNVPFDVYIGRSSSWGNRFVIGKDGSRATVIERFKQETKANPELIAMAREVLKGRTLGCHCKPLACHGDVWVEILDGEES